jgi:glucose-1-phosphate thymidylyltransferase
MKGIILAGGKGSRLYPLTQPINKQLLPVYDTPMIYYPLSTLMRANIRDICIISSPEYLNAYQQLLGDGNNIGLSISYKTQEKPEGIAQAFIIAEDFIKNDNVCLILGDNIFHGDINFNFQDGAKVFAYKVKNPEEYGVVRFEKNKVLELIEKPKDYISSYAVPGLYLYDKEVINITKQLKPSARGELEITDVNNIYLKRDKLFVSKLQQGFVWLDAGAPTALFEASAYVHTIEARQGSKIACIEEIAFRKKFITALQFKMVIENIPNSEYKNYLQNILNRE